jgi:hypothetical protein
MGAAEALGGFLLAADVLAQDPPQEGGAWLTAAVLVQPEDQLGG